jgi:hypothetical protein
LVSYRGPYLGVKGFITNSVCAGQVEIQAAFERSLEAHPASCYKSEMSKIVEQWLLFKYVGLEFTPLSKPFKTKKEAEKAREKYPERRRKTIGLGVIRIKK